MSVDAVSVSAISATHHHTQTTVAPPTQCLPSASRHSILNDPSCNSRGPRPATHSHYYAIVICLCRMRQCPTSTCNQQSLNHKIVTRPSDYFVVVTLREKRYSIAWMRYIITLDELYYCVRCVTVLRRIRYIITWDGEIQKLYAKNGVVHRVSTSLSIIVILVE